MVVEYFYDMLTLPLSVCCDKLIAITFDLRRQFSPDSSPERVSTFYSRIR